MSGIEIKRLTDRINELEKIVRHQELSAFRFQLHNENVRKCCRRVVPNVVVLTLCINYADKLRISLKHNAKMFRQLYVITTKEDTKTVDVCSKYKNVECIYTDKMHANGAVFNKSAMVRQAQDLLHVKYPTSWILLLDADIVLPKKFPAIAKIAGDLDKTALYSMYRVDFHKKTDFDQKTNAVIYRENFMGFFQMYYDKARVYPYNSNNCAECDLTFSKQFTTKHMLSDFDCVYHLGRENDNWNGRVSEWW